MNWKIVMNKKKSNKFALFLLLKIYNTITGVKGLNLANRITRVKTLAFADLLMQILALCSFFPFPFKAYALWGPQKLCRLNFAVSFNECDRGGVEC